MQNIRSKLCNVTLTEESKYTTQNQNATSHIIDKKHNRHILDYESFTENIKDLKTNILKL